MKKIGILGGIGPESTAELYLRIIQKAQTKGVRRNTDYPHIIINSIPAPELFSKNPNLKPYIQGFKALEKAGAKKILIACNTAYLLLNTFQKTTKIPIINLRREVKKKLTAQKILILGTHNTIKQGLFRFSGKKYIELTDSEIKKLDKAIFELNQGKNKKKNELFVINLAKKYSKKADKILVACTELSVALKNQKLPIIDTMDILAEAALR
ncbi:amino acid racemase [Candidatus Woesearchaeota archaeon]|nr:amino acid racemase [Candidatus Woesearchaeota archaeon]